MKPAALLAAILSLFLWCAPAHAQNFSRSAVCTPENSEATTVAAIAADPQAWFGRCARVDGLYTGERVYADLDAIYGLDANWVGGFIDGQPPMPGAWRGLFTGRVFDCAEAWDTVLNQQLRTPGISLNERPLGCTEGKGPFLMFMTGSELKPSGLKRRLPGGKGGNLEAGDWPAREAMLKLSMEFASALEAKVVPDLTHLLGNSYVAERIANDPASIWARLTPQQPRAFEMFRDTSVTGDLAAGEACWALTKDFAKRWPIDSRDADNQPIRPYACLRVEGVLRDGEWVLRLDPSVDVDGLEEP